MRARVEKRSSSSTVVVLCLPSFAYKSWLEWDRIAALNRAAISLSLSPQFPLFICLRSRNTSLTAEFFFGTLQKMNSDTCEHSREWISESRSCAGSFFATHGRKSGLVGRECQRWRRGSSLRAGKYFGTSPESILPSPWNVRPKNLSDSKNNVS